MKANAAFLGRPKYPSCRLQIMEKAVSAADANRKFSKLLRAVREGHSYVVTSHGKADLLIQTADQTLEPRNRRVDIAVR